MKNGNGRPMIVLAGEQAAPNLLPARYFRPSRVIIAHTAAPKSKRPAENLAICLAQIKPELRLIAGFDPGDALRTMVGLLAEFPGAVVNVTGGTKPMFLAALLAAREKQAHPFYVRTDGANTMVDWYCFDGEGRPALGETEVIEDTITIDDYLTVYFGTNYRFTGPCKASGGVFEEAVMAALEPEVSEIRAGWKHESGAVDVDLIVRCGNQIAIVQVKGGRKAEKTEGIKQLAVAGGQRFFGTYARRVLVVDRSWPQRGNNRALAEALNITLVELPGYAATGSIEDGERRVLVGEIHRILGTPVAKGACS